MIAKIKKIKNLGFLFKNYSWGSGLPDFKKVNLVYGWNGSGKTTLSCLFDVIGGGDSGQHSGLQYEICGNHDIYTQAEKFIQNVRVFNRNYIAKNVSVLEGKANHIFILGEENKKLLDEIKADETNLGLKRERLKSVSDKLEKKQAEKGKRFTDAARSFTCLVSGEAARAYTKRNAEKAFGAMGAPVIFDDGEVNARKLTLSQRERIEIKIISLVEELVLLNGLLQKAQALLAKTVEAGVVCRLRDFPEISAWVESGLAIHKKHGSQCCEYCGGKISAERIAELARHFNEEDQQLKREVLAIITELKAVDEKIYVCQPVDVANLYDELQKEYAERVAAYVKEQKELRNNISSAISLLSDKRSKTTEVIVYGVANCCDALKSAAEGVNQIVEQHNEKSKNFSKVRSEAVGELEKHCLSEISESVKILDGEILSADAERKSLEDEIRILSFKISESRGKISSPEKACAEINSGLRQFLGREEISFKVEEDGYVITRNGAVASELSEGEKTAIAFVYFVVHLKDQDFDISKGIVVVDDPISSLDSNSLFQAFAFLKCAVASAEQVFLFTHNFEFLKLLLNWRKGEDRNLNCTGCYMLKNQISEGQRCALLGQMDKTLSQYESEYHYLYSILKEMCIQQDGTIEAAYPVPNIARKVFETFLMFRVPNGKSMFSKVEALKKEGFDSVKLTAIYKFVNDQSHITGAGFDPSLVEETRKNVEYLFDIMRESFPAHVKILEEAISPA